MMKDKVKDSVSEIKLSDESKKRILSDVKNGNTSGRIKAPVMRYVSVAAIVCVLAASVVVSIYVSDQNKPAVDEHIRTTQEKGAHDQGSEILTEGGQKIYGGANIGDGRENNLSSAPEQSKTETSPHSEKAETSSAPEVSQSPDISEIIDTYPDALEITEEMSYKNLNGLYVEGSLYKKIMEDNTNKVYDIRIFPYNDDEINDFVYEGNKYGDVYEKYSNAEINWNIILDVMIYFDDKEESNGRESSDAYAGNYGIDYNLSSEVLVVSPPYNDALLKIVDRYKKEDGTADNEKLNAEKENLEKTIDELKVLIEKIRVAYNTQFAEKAKKEFIRCGMTNVEIIRDMCCIKATADQLKAFIPESKDTYALYEKVNYEQGAVILE